MNIYYHITILIKKGEKMTDKSKEIVTKNCTYNFSVDMINIKKFYLNKIIQKWKVIQKYSYLLHRIYVGQRP